MHRCRLGDALHALVPPLPQCALELPSRGAAPRLPTRPYPLTPLIDPPWQSRPPWPSMTRRSGGGGALSAARRIQDLPVPDRYGAFASIFASRSAIFLWSSLLDLHPLSKRQCASEVPMSEATSTARRTRAGSGTLALPWVPASVSTAAAAAAPLPLALHLPRPQRAPSCHTNPNAATAQF